MFHRWSSVQCFFCHTLTTSPKDPRNFRCNNCGCWNRYDTKGEILSSEPAMHDESLNLRSFSKRASPNKERLPTMYGKGPFCHTCQTNQMLLVNLLSNYLPDPDSPEYERRVEMLPEYKESLHIRYPPVCANCLPSVEDEIQNKNKMARVNALGGFLKDTKGKEQARRVLTPELAKEKLTLEMLIWRCRGCLWGASLLIAVVGYSASLLNLPVPFSNILCPPVLPIVTFVSIFWTFWDPTYSSLQRARREGRNVRIQGKKNYIALQMVSWLSRLFTSISMTIAWYRPMSNYLHLLETPISPRASIYYLISLILELSVFISSCFVLRLQQPPAIRLLELNQLPSRAVTPNPNTSHSNTPLTPPIINDSDLLASLTLSSKPVIAKPPIFGVPSLGSSAPHSTAHQPENDIDEMDWTPTNGQKEKPRTYDDSSFLRPQKFFAPENPTGLESLFESTRLVDDITMNEPTPERASTRSSIATAHLWNWGWVYLLSTLPVAGVILFQRVYGKRYSGPAPTSEVTSLFSIHDVSSIE
ncbi:Ima1 N-terminal domain-containing protein [Desarmillaria tabescens]|uniref:Ima1 N-terminal domain-containing protein n=1 Tax=Armillaria tabescens TaxID=1929756 RepID=A0AA39NG42_ARMTA|nr:Ima1 N-terminal domain-containing protein [Desarmillaria tabescens]KAK0464975.1 Ima1 N-terminal domain-containing protein [Desarmillaria tabescens]